MDDGEELRECGVSLVRLEDMKVENRGVLEEAMEVRDLEDHLNLDLQSYSSISTLKDQH